MLKKNKKTKENKINVKKEIEIKNVSDKQKIKSKE